MILEAIHSTNKKLRRGATAVEIVFPERLADLETTGLVHRLADGWWITDLGVDLWHHAEVAAWHRNKRTSNGGKRPRRPETPKPARPAARLVEGEQLAMADYGWVAA